MKKIILNIILFIIPFVITANTYYVATYGNDANPGTETQPWASIQKAAGTLIAGDSVFIKSGTYPERVILQHSGAANNYIVFSNYQNDTVIIDGSGISWGGSWNGLFDISDKSYIQVIGLQLNNTEYAGFWIENSEHIIIRDCKTYNTFSSGAGVWNSAHIAIRNNEVELACNDGEQECITVANSHHCEIYGNTVHHNGQGTNGGEGIDIKQGSHDVNVYKNVVNHLNNRLGIYADAWDLHTCNINISQNIIHHCSESGIAVASEAGGLIENVNIYNNIIYLNKYGGIELGAWSDIGFPGVKPIANIKIINNTCYKNGAYDNGWGYGIVIDNPDANNVIVRNNICSENSAQIAIQQIGGGGIVDHNLFYGNNSASGTLYGLDSIIANPLFVDANGYNFHLQNNSPAVDTGSPNDAPEVDFDNNSRPYGNAYDLGAYELSSSFGIQNDKSGSLCKIFPNPCQDKLTVEFLGEVGQNHHLQLFDDKGSIIVDKIYSGIGSSSIICKTSHLKPGLYFMIITTAGRISGTKKLIVR